MLPPGGRSRSRSLPPPATCRCSWSSARVASALRVQPVGGRGWRVPVSPRWPHGGRARPAFLPQLPVPQPGSSRAGPARAAERTGFANACGPPLRPSAPVIPKGERTAWKTRAHPCMASERVGKARRGGCVTCTASCDIRVLEINCFQNLIPLSPFQKEHAALQDPLQTSHLSRN